MIADLRPGDIGFGPNLAAVNWGQLVLGEGFHVGRLKIGHVFVVTEVGPWAVEAMPHGARQVAINDRWTPEYAYVRLPEDYPGQGEDAAAIAKAMIGTPYSVASYAALAAWRFGLKTPRLERWIDRRHEPDGIGHGYVSHRTGVRMAPRLPREAICSVLADQAWTLAGKQVVTGVAHQCVTPGRLAMALLEMNGAQWIWPQ